MTSYQPQPYISSPCLKLSDPGRGSGDLHGLLSTTHHHLNHTQVSKVSNEMHQVEKKLAHSHRIHSPPQYFASLHLHDP